MRNQIDNVVKILDRMLKFGVNINFYMFCGGTNFGFTAGSLADDSEFNSGVTS